MSITNSRILRRVSGDWSLLANDSTSLTLLNLSYGLTAGTLGGFNITITKSIFQVFGGSWDDGGVVGVLWSYWLCWGGALVDGCRC